MMMVKYPIRGRYRPFAVGDRVRVIGAKMPEEMAGLGHLLSISATGTIVRVGQLQAIIRADWVRQTSIGDSLLRTVHISQLQLVSAHDPESTDDQI